MKHVNNLMRLFIILTCLLALYTNAQAAYSRSSHTATAGQVSFIVDFADGVIDVGAAEDVVEVWVNGVKDIGASVTWTSSTTLDLSGYTAVAGDTIEFRRVTPKEELFVDFTAGSSLRTTTVDLNMRQLLHTAHEAIDASEVAALAEDYAIQAAADAASADASATAAAASAAAVNYQKVATLAELQAYTGDADLLYVEGRTTAGDGYQGFFKKVTGTDLSAEVTADTQHGIYVAPTSDPTGASGAWVRQLNGFVTPGMFGCVKDSTAAKVTNFTPFKNMIQSGLPCYIDGVYYLSTEETITLGQSLSISGSHDSIVYLYYGGSSSLFTLSSIDKVKLSKVSFIRAQDETTSVRLFSMSGTIAINEMTIKECYFENTHLLWGTMPTDVDPTVSYFGIRKFIFNDNSVNGTSNNFASIPNSCCSHLEIVGNKIKNTNFQCFNFGDEPSTYAEKIKSLTKTAVVRNNSLICDEDYYAAITSGGYLVFLLYEGRDLEYTNNYVEGLKTLGNADASDIYANVENLVYRGNTSKNNISMSADKAVASLIHSKSSGNKVVDGNYFVIDQALLTLNNATAANGKAWVTLFDKIHTNTGDVVSISNNDFNIPVLLGYSSAMIAASFSFENNRLKIGSTAAAMFFNWSSNDIDYASASIRINRNTFDIEKCEPIKRGVSTYTYGAFYRFDDVGTYGDYSNITVKDNDITIKDASLTYQLFQGDIAANYIDISNTTLKWLTVDDPTYLRQFNLIINRGLYSITGNKVQSLSKLFDTSNLPKIGPDVKGVFEVAQDCLQLAQYLYIAKPTTLIGVRVAFETRKNGVSYNQYYTLSMSNTGVTFINASDLTETIAYTTGGFGYPKVQTLVPDAAMTGVKFSLSDTSGVGLVFGHNEISAGDAAVIKMRVETF